MGVYFGPQTEITNGLILQLDAARKDSYPGSGNTWYDISGNGNHATSSNLIFNSSNGGNFIFNGTNAALVSANQTLLNLQTPLTMSAWIKVTDFGPSTEIGILYQFVNWLTLNNQKLFTVQRNGPFYISYACQKFNSNATGFTNTNPITLNKWMYTAVSLSGYTTTKILVFINDSYQQSTTEALGGYTSTPPIYIGAGQWNNGSIAQISVYNRELSVQEILQNYNSRRGLYAV